MTSEEETDKEFNEILKQAKIRASKSREEIEIETMRAIKNFILSKKVFDLFDMAIEKVKKPPTKLQCLKEPWTIALE